MKYRDFVNYEIYPYEEKVYSEKRNKELTPSTNNKGYLSFKLYKNGKQYCIRANRLFYECVHGEIPEGFEIDHIDNNRNNNHPDNLRAVTHTENMNNPLSLEVRKKVFSDEKMRKQLSKRMKGRFSGEKNPMYGKPRPDGGGSPPKPINVFKNGELFATYPCINEAAKDLDLSRGNINSCLNGLRKHTKGYTFEFV